MPVAPAVTVLMAVYADAAFVGEAVDSILGQSFGDFELLVVDDSSTDGSAEIVASRADPRVRIVRNEQNVGLTRSLARGLPMAGGRYVARMDADDVAHPERLARQVAFLDAHPDVGLLGTAHRYVDEHGRRSGLFNPPLGDAAIRWTCLLANPFAHPTAMLRRSLLDRTGLNYDPTFRTAQDYDLWSRLLAHTRGANLAQPLLDYRMRAGVTATRRPEQLANHDAIAHRTIASAYPRLGLDRQAVSALRRTFVGGEPVAAPRRRAALALRYLDLLDAFLRGRALDAEMSRLAAAEALKAAVVALRPTASWSAALVGARAVATGRPRGLARASLPTLRDKIRPHAANGRG